MIQWSNYFVLSKKSFANEGHLPADQLRGKILSHDGHEAYHCAYDLEARETFKDYVGLMRPALGYVWFDFDSHDGGELAWQDTKAFVAEMNCEQAFVAYSGSKGFHVGIPDSIFGIVPAKDLGVRLNKYASELKKKYTSIDTTIYNANRKFRALGSKHDKTGLYKMRVTNLKLYLSEIRIQAATRGDLRIPLPDTFVPLHRLPEAQSVAAPAVEAPKEWKAASGATSFKKCSFLAFCKAYPAQVSEPQWYALASIVARFENGREQFHALSKGHPKYSASETDAKFDQAMKESAPRTCENISTLWDGCPKCPMQGKVESPVNILTAKERRELLPSRPKETEIADQFLSEVGDRMMRQEKSIFSYRDGHWKELTLTQKDSMKKRVFDLYGGHGTSRTVDSTFTTFHRALKPVPPQVNLFDPNPFCANFLNGSLHLRQSREFFYETEFLPHRKEDYLNTVLPFHYDAESKEVNAPFLEMLDRIFKGDPDREEKIRAVRQMFGACLVPAFPRLFFLWGPSGCGKSTLMLIAKKFLSESNVSGVQPYRFTGFGMEPMIGKLANIVTDVDTKRPMQDSEMKMIIDRTPVYIERKGLTNIHGMLPAIHLFGGNEIPPTLEGSLGAHTRRWTFIHCKNMQTEVEGGLYNKEFHQWVFEQSPQGILNFALEGLKDLISRRGHYTVPSSGVEKMTEWQSESDPIALFVEDARNGEIKHLGVEKSAKINRVELYEVFKVWSEQVGYKWVSLDRKKFYAALRAKKFDEEVSNGVRYFSGFLLKISPGAEY